MQIIYMQKNREKAWLVVEEEDGWYYYTKEGDPIGPFVSEEIADWALDDYADDQDRTE